MDVQIDLLLIDERDVSAQQRDEMLRLQAACFSSVVTAEEVEDDFHTVPVARVLAVHATELIGCAPVFQREIEYNGRALRIGGFGPCTREDWRRRGVGVQICTAAMDYLRRKGCEIAFLSVDTRRETHRLYERLGFRMLPRPFIYANVRGELKESDGGMVAPLGSLELFGRILTGDQPFALTPETGYW